MNLLTRRHQIIASAVNSSERLIYSLSNYTCDGTANTAINTGLQLCTGDYMSFRIEYDFIINAMTPQNACFLRCRHETKAVSVWPGFGIRTSNSSVAIQLNGAEKGVTGGIGVRCTGTIILNKDIITSTCNGTTVTNNLIPHTSPFVIGGELSNSTTGAWNANRFSQMMINYIKVYVSSDYDYDFFNFEALQAGSTIGIMTYGGASPIVYYSYNKEDWTLWDGSDITLTNVGDKIYLYGTTDTSSYTNDKYYAFTGSGKLKIAGDMTTLITKFGRQLRTNCFRRLFRNNEAIVSAKDAYINSNTFPGNSLNATFEGCTNLVSAPNITVGSDSNTIYGDAFAAYMFKDCLSLTNVSGIKLSTNGVDQAYIQMFQGCSSLAIAPVIVTNPVHPIGARIFNAMFRDCTSLVDISNISISGPMSTYLGHQCANMFNGCTSLTSVPSDFLSSVTTLYNECYDSMFSNCTSLTSVPELPAITLAYRCYRSMFKNCTSLTTAPELLATTLAEDCYREMFNGCTSLTAAPELPAITLASNCYRYMFQGCTNLTTAPELPATTLANYCYGSMFYNCSALTTAPELPATTLAEGCYSAMFYGCSSLTTAPELPVTTLAEECYNSMFESCTNLVTAPELPATILAVACYYEMFAGCIALTAAPELPATTLANGCYRYMFMNCTSLTTAPELRAQTLVDTCYNTMFKECRSLNYIKCLATDISASNCLYNWLSNVNVNGTFVKASGVTWPSGANGIPNGWTVIDATD